MTDNETQRKDEQTPAKLSLPAKCRLRFTLKSDWHVGSGTGRPGNIDSLIQRDSDGLPYLPAKTVTGILRDASEQLAYGLDDGKKGNWSKLTEILFGNQPALPNEPVEKRPHASLIRIASAHYSSNLRNHIKRTIENIAEDRAKSSEDDNERTANAKSYKQQLARQIRAASVFIKPGVSIDPATGQAKTDFLRFEEMGRKGVALEADCVLDFDSLKDELKPFAKALLLASALLVERIGGKRRRGAGRCDVEIVRAKDSDTLSSSKDAISWLMSNGAKLDLSERKQPETANCDSKNAKRSNLARLPKATNGGQSRSFCV
ncbi:MAG: RAMP superfamily CRISPR-associated protein [Pyrinomonadaceae bacterium]